MKSFLHRNSRLRRARLEKEAAAEWATALQTQYEDVRLALGIAKASLGTGVWRPPARTGDFSLLDYRALLAPTTLLLALRCAEAALQKGAALGAADAIRKTTIAQRPAEIASVLANQWARDNAPGAVDVVDRTSTRRLSALLAAWMLGRQVAEMDGALLDLYSSSRAATIGVTLVARGYNAGAISIYRSDGRTKALRWITQNDERTCTLCGPLHGAVGTIDGVFPGGQTQPAHARCRCTVEPFEEARRS